VLGPLGSAFGVAAALRASAYRRGILATSRLKGAVVSVGNLAVGGSGKTPVVALVARLLVEQGHTVAVLSRGYGGSFGGESLVVCDGTRLLASAREAGDEPVMLARELPGVVVAVGRRRDVVGREVEERFGRCVHVLDDGFQHLRLARDLDILCLDAADLRDRPLPAGRLREKTKAAGRAGAVLVGGLSGPDDVRYAQAWAFVGPQRTFRLGRQAAGFVCAGAEIPAPVRPFLLAAIARPERFRDDVRASSGAVTGEAFFRDHHAFSARELGSIDAAARVAGSDAIVTTAKDAERIDPAALALPLVVYRTRASVDDLPRLRDLVLSAVGGRA
jgi:tetraacyldisaccharide 4'-kinase